MTIALRWDFWSNRGQRDAPATRVFSARGIV